MHVNTGIHAGTGITAASTLMGVMMMGLSAVGQEIAGETRMQPGPPVHLRCEYLVDPLGIDLNPPRLSWEVNDPRRGAKQLAYHVVVSRDDTFMDERAVVWDTGKVMSDQSIHVNYGGAALESRVRYAWRVRTWDGDDRVSAWSEPAWWEMGRLEKTDWKARWIIPSRIAREEETLTGASWLWHPDVTGEDTHVYFRLPLEIPADRTIDEAHFNVTVDDDFELFVNGERVAARGGWSTVHKFELEKHLRPGSNVIAVRAHNDGGPGAMIATLRLHLDDGAQMRFVSDEKTWKMNAEAAGGWTTLAFDDSAWRPAHVVAPYGEGPWGSLPFDAQARRVAYMVRQAFEIEKTIKRARAYVTGLGLYELRLNGEKVGDDIFTPGWTHYGKRVQYQTYDVTAQLRRGENAVGAYLGNGWWASGMGGNWRRLKAYADSEEHRFLLQLEIEYEDGSRDTVLTNEEWTSHASPIIDNSFYHGVHYDARLEQAGWDEPGYDASAWLPCQLVDTPKDLLVAQRCQPIQVTDVREPMHISEPDKGVYIVDFGQNASGWVEMRVRGEPGDEIQLRFGEELDPNGRLYRNNYRSARATDIYVCKGGREEVWEPRFTYRGFRYCEVTGWPQADKEHPRAPGADAFRMKVVHSAAPMAGEFECSNTLINSINDAIIWGQRSNLHSVPTDCPQRDERLGWTGDAQAFAYTSCYNMDMASFWSKWMKDLADSQNPEGFVTDIAPASEAKHPAKPGWGDAVTIVPWVVYRYYGDTQVIEENYDTIRGWVEFMRSRSEGDLYEVEGYGDWVAPVGTHSAPIGSLYFYHSTDLLAKMARAIGREDDAAEYAALASRIGRAFHAKHFNPETKHYWDGTQTANILPLWFGVVPDEHRPAVLSNLVENIRQRGYRLSTGFLGTPYLMPLLSACGEDETAWRLAVQTDQPSWGYMVRHGATTIWERWDSDKHGPSMNSRNHFAFGVVGQWYYQTLAGIRLDPDVPGFKRLVIRPQPLGDLDRLKASYPTMYGQARVHWSRCRDSLHMDVTIPANTTAEIHVPTLGHNEATIREGDTVVVQRGQPAAGTPSLRPLSADEFYASFDAGAGTYRFYMGWK